jgi:hypothetical protein
MALVGLEPPGSRRLFPMRQSLVRTPELVGQDPRGLDVFIVRTAGVRFFGYKAYSNAPLCGITNSLVIPAKAGIKDYVMDAESSSA